MWVLHVDLDEFLAAVEMQRRPELRGKPVVVGGAGDPTQRAVVATASYEARAFGIHSGMPMRTAAKLCPDAVFLANDKPTYEAVSEEVMATLRELPVVVEVLGWDEAFLAPTGPAADTTRPEQLATQVQRAVQEHHGLVCSVGIGDNRLRAKVATGFAKPAGVYRLTEATWFDVMGARPTDALWGVGAKTARKLTEMGIETVAQLAETDHKVLARRFGPTMGPWFKMLALGIGGTEVTADPYVPKSRSREVTFQRNISDPVELADQLVLLSRQVADDVASEGRDVARVGVKVRYAPFFTQTRSITLPAVTRDAAVLEDAARQVLALFELGSEGPVRPIRLLGVRAEFVSD